MKILPLRSDLKEYLAKRGLKEKFEKQQKFFENNRKCASGVSESTGNTGRFLFSLKKM
ncbi:MAG: hypothetical protein AAB799_01910 [Patescibacteria group bacterium]